MDRIYEQLPESSLARESIDPVSASLDAVNARPPKDNHHHRHERVQSFADLMEYNRRRESARMVLLQLSPAEFCRRLLRTTLRMALMRPECGWDSFEENPPGRLITLRFHQRPDRYGQVVAAHRAIRLVVENTRGLAMGGAIGLPDRVRTHHQCHQAAVHTGLASSRPDDPPLEHKRLFCRHGRPNLC